MESDYDKAAEKFDYVRFTFCDLHGCAKSKVVTSEGLQDAMTSGVPAFFGLIAFGVDGNPYNSEPFPGEEDPGDIVKNFGNVAYMPQPNTVRPVPWCTNNRVGQVLCEPQWEPHGRPLASGPRWVARQQLENLADMGFSLFSGFEAEITIYDIIKEEAMLPEMTYFRNRFLPQIEPLLIDIHKNLKQAGVQLHDFHTEMGRGQIELVMPPAYGIETADNGFLLREGVKHTCILQNKEAIFMTHPFFSDHISLGWHFSHSLRDIKTGDPIFNDQNDSNGLSDVCRHWIAGLATHCKALTAICCPTVNCYRRLNQMVTPRNNTWGIDNRHVTFRVKTGSPSSTYAECRLPSSASNPYLVMAAVLAAGMDGVKRNLVCPPTNDPNADKLPATLEEALVCLEEDSIMVNALGEQFVKCFVNLKRKMELSQFPNWEHTRDMEATFDKEREYYFTNL